MTSHVKRSTESINSIVENERIRGSIFDRLSNKQVGSNQSNQFKNYHLHKKSTKFENMEYSNSKFLSESSKSNSERRIGQYSHNKINHENNLSPENIYYKTSSKSINSEQLDKIACSSKHSNRHLLKNEIPIKEDIQNNIKSSHLNEKLHKFYKESDIYKKHYHDQGAEVLEKKRIQLTRELQMIDQKDKKINAHHHHSSKQSAFKSPYSNSSHSICSSSGSSNTGSYTGSSVSCTGSSCSSSSYSDDDRLAHVSSCRSKKNLFCHHRRCMKHILEEGVCLENDYLHNPQTPPIITKSNKKYKTDNHTPSLNNYQVSVSSRKLRSRSPQSTNSSYYSRKSHLLTSPNHLQHSASPSVASASQSIKTDNIKLDRHGNIRVSLREKERQRRIVEIQHQSIATSPSNFNFQNQIYSKSRSPVSRIRDDYYSSEEKHRYNKNSTNYNRENLLVSPLNKLENNKKKMQCFNDYYQNREYEEKFHRLEDKTFLYKSGSAYKQRDSLTNEYLDDDNYNLNDNKSLVHRTSLIPKVKDYEKKSRNYLNEDINLCSTEYIKKNDEKKQFSSLEEPNLNEIFNYTNESHNLKLQNKQNSCNSSNKYKAYQINSKTYSKSPENNQILFCKDNLNQYNRSNMNSSKFIEKEITCSNNEINTTKENMINLESKLDNHIDEISSISNNSLDDFELFENKSLSDYQEKLEENEQYKTNNNQLVNKNIDLTTKDNIQISINFDLNEKNNLNEKNEENEENEVNEENEENKNLKNEEIVSDENFSDWSDIEDYENLINNDELEQKSESDKFIYDIKFKGDEELEAISDDEFDAIIDEQELENEKKGILSCKKVLDQLDIDWESLKQTNEDDYQPILNSSVQQFKPANLLSQIGISQKYAGNELSQKIVNYCKEHLKDNNFNFESPIATYHSMFLRNRKEDFLSRGFDLQKFFTNNSIENSSVELRKLLSNGNVSIRKSFNHLLEKIRQKTIKIKNNKIDDSIGIDYEKHEKQEYIDLNKNLENENKPFTTLINSLEYEQADKKLYQIFNLQSNKSDGIKNKNLNEVNLKEKLPEFVNEKK